MRDDAIALYEQREALRAELRDYESKAQAGAEDTARAILKGYKLRIPKKETALSMLMTYYPEDHQALVKPVREHYQAILFASQWTDGLLRSVILEHDLRPLAGDQKIALGWIYGHYNQTNDEHYKRAQIALLREQAEELGIRATSEESFVYAFVTHPVDIEIIKMNPLPLKEWVRRCWKKGVNPRVYNPYLPHGFEEANGLDYFGNEVKKG